MADFVKQIKDKVVDFKDHWDKPYEGRYIPNKEVVAYGVGGMGMHCATVLSAGISLSASNLIVGSCIQIMPTHLYIMTVISNLIGFLFCAVRSYLFDNVKSKMGKFRPFIKWLGLPTVLSSCLFVWMPYEIMTYNQKCVTVFILWLVLNMFHPFYWDAYQMLMQVLSPDSEERTDVMSISQIIFSFAPTVTNLIIPFLAQLTGGLADMRTYRIIYPIIAFIGLILSFPTYKYTTERIIKPRDQENEVGFIEAIRSIVKNKYFWIISVAAWAGFLEMSYYSILHWSFIYDENLMSKQHLLGVANTLIGNGALWAMIAAPFLIRKFGKRNLLIACNATNILLLASLYFTYKNILIVIAIFYINNFVLVLGNVYNPGINADMRDYQQYISGERIDGMFGVVGLIGTFISFFTGMVMPYLQERCGLKDNYDVLYDPAIRDGLFKMMIIASVVGATLNVIPYLFYDLTEKKHRGIVYVLRIRAMFDDYSAGKLTDDELVKSFAIINDIKEATGKEYVNIDKTALKQAKALPKSTKEEKEYRKSMIKQAKQALHNQKMFNENVDLAPFVNEELNKFSTKRFELQVDLANYINENSELSPQQLLDYTNSLIDSFTSEKTKENKQIVSDLKATRTIIKRAIKIRQKYYANGVVKPDENAVENAQNLPSNTVKLTIERKKAVRKAVKEKANYKNAMKPYTDAKKLLIQHNAYLCMDELEARYNELVSQNSQAVTA